MKEQLSLSSDLKINHDDAYDGKNSDENMLEAGSEEFDDYSLQDRLNTTTITTTTRIATVAPKTYHCRGEGLTGRATHWSALPAPSCHGKWLRLTVGTPTRCSEAQFMFV